MADGTARLTVLASPFYGGTIAAEMIADGSGDVSSLKLDARIDGAAAAQRIHEERPVAIVLSGEHIGPDLAERIAALPVFGVLPPGASAAHLRIALAVAHARHQEWRREQIRADELTQRLEDRKVIERAKGILMQREGLSESDAYRMLQRTSQSRNVPMAELSRSLLAAEELIAPPSRPPVRRPPSSPLTSPPGR